MIRGVAGRIRIVECPDPQCHLRGGEPPSWIFLSQVVPHENGTLKAPLSDL